MKHTLKPNRLEPPKEHAIKFMQKDRERLPKDNFRKFIKKFFFGDGY